MTIPIIDDIPPEKMVEQKKAPSGTEVTIRFTKVEQKFVQDKETKEETNRAYLSIFSVVCKAANEEYLGIRVPHMVMIPGVESWYEYHKAKDGPDKAQELLTSYIDRYTRWCRIALGKRPEEADTELYPGREINCILKLEDDAVYGERNSIQRILE